MANPINDTGWQKPVIVEGTGVITSPSTVEAKPCYLCKSFEKDTRKLAQYVTAHGMMLEPDGCYVFRMVSKEFPTRQQFRLDPKKTGWCRKLCTLAMDEATCEQWCQRATAEDMRGIIR